MEEHASTNFTFWVAVILILGLWFPLPAASRSSLAQVLQHLIILLTPPTQAPTGATNPAQVASPNPDPDPDPNPDFGPHQVRGDQQGGHGNAGRSDGRKLFVEKVVVRRCL
jgi:hypothetical protein